MILLRSRSQSFRLLSETSARVFPREDGIVVDSEGEDSVSEDGYRLVSSQPWNVGDCVHLWALGSFPVVEMMGGHKPIQQALSYLSKQGLMTGFSVAF